MPGNFVSRYRGWVLPGITVAAVGLAVLASWRVQPVVNAPNECSLNPTAYYPGTFKGWRLSRSSPDAGGEISATIDLDDGRQVIAYNAANAELESDLRVTVSEIVCANRTIYLLTDFPSSEAVDLTSSR